MTTILRSELHLPLAPSKKSKFPNLLCKLCDIKDWQIPEIRSTILDFMKPQNNEVLIHRKAWEFAMTVVALKKFGLWNEKSVGLSVAGGHERLLYYATQHIARMVAVDIYGEGDFADSVGTEASAEFLVNPGKFAPYPYHAERLKPLWMNALKLEFAEATFDFAYSLSSIEHFGGLTSAITALREMRRVVKPGGLVCIAVDCVINGDNSVKFFTPDEVYTMIGESDLELVQDIDWSLSETSLDYLIDMATDDLNTVPHINLTAFGSIFTSLYLVLTKKVRPGRFRSGGAYSPVGQTDLASFDLQISQLADKPRSVPDVSAYLQFHTLKESVSLPVREEFTQNGEAVEGAEQTQEETVQHWLKGFPPQSPVIVVVTDIAYDATLSCLDALLTTTPASIPILIINDGSAESVIEEVLHSKALEGHLYSVNLAENSGLAHCLNLAVKWSGSRDVIVLGQNVVVPPTWLERLQAAAYVCSNSATATPYTNNGSYLSVPNRNTPSNSNPFGMSVEQVDANIRQASLRLRPIIPTALNYCAYYRRDALELVGAFKESLFSGYGEDIDFSQRAVSNGFCHVLADDLFVYCQGLPQEPADLDNYLRERQQRRINQHYPWYQRWLHSVNAETEQRFGQAYSRAYSALTGNQIAIDATCLTENPTGTQFVVAGLTRALAASAPADCQLSLIVSDNLPRHKLYGLKEVVDNVFSVSELAKKATPTFDLVHRPFQVFAESDLNFLKRVARRTVITQMDFIYYSNPTYFKNYQDWLNFQRLTAKALKSVDGVAYMSQTAASDAAHQGFDLPDERQSVTYIGLENPFAQTEATPPRNSCNFQGQPFLLVIGNNYRHKNRAYALKLFEILVEQYQWEGALVMAGPTVDWGSSQSDEARLKFASSLLRERVHNLGLVSEEEKNWLLRHAALVIYPSIYEGFGIVPFETANYGTPALTGYTSAMGEILGEEVTYLSMTDPMQGAQTIWALLTNPSLANRQIELIQEKAVEFSWEKAAQLSWEFYRRILSLPARATSNSSSYSIVEEKFLPEKARLLHEYGRLEGWAKELNQRLLHLEKRRGFRLLQRFKFL